MRIHDGYLCDKAIDFVPAERTLFDWVMVGAGLGFIAAILTYVW